RELLEILVGEVQIPRVAPVLIEALGEARPRVARDQRVHPVVLEERGAQPLGLQEDALGRVALRFERERGLGRSRAEARVVGRRLALPPRVEQQAWSLLSARRGAARR